MLNFTGQADIEIGGKVRPALLCYNQLSDFCSLYGGNLLVWDRFIADYLAGRIDLEKVRNVMYTCLKWGAKKQKEAVDFTVEDVGFWMDEMSQDEYTKFKSLLVTTIAKFFEQQKKSQLTTPLQNQN